MIADRCARRLDNLDIGQILMTSIVPIERSPVNKPAETTVKILKQNYTTSYLLFKRLESKPEPFLIDTDCTINLLSIELFNPFPERIKCYLEI